MSLMDFARWYNIDTKRPVTEKHVYHDEDGNVRWATGTIWGGRSIEYDVKDFNAWKAENLPFIFPSV